MAKTKTKGTGLTGVTKLSEKKVLPKKAMQPVNRIDEVAKAIEKEKAMKEKTVRVTIDVPESEYLDMKTKLVTERRTIRNYFLDLMRKDMQ